MHGCSEQFLLAGHRFILGGCTVHVGEASKVEAAGSFSAAHFAGPRRVMQRCDDAAECSKCGVVQLRVLWTGCHALQIAAAAVAHGEPL